MLASDRFVISLELMLVYSYILINVCCLCIMIKKWAVYDIHLLLSLRKISHYFIYWVGSAICD
jgi:hypothetical protein